MGNSLGPKIKIKINLDPKMGSSPGPKLQIKMNLGLCWDPLKYLQICDVTSTKTGLRF